MLFALFCYVLSTCAAVKEEREAKRARHDVRLFAQLQIPAAPVPLLQQQDDAMDLDAPPTPATKSPEY